MLEANSGKLISPAVRATTPQCGKASFEASSNTDHEKSQDAVLEDAGPSIVEVTADEFVNTLLPEVPCPHETLQKIVRWVKNESGEYSNGRWTAFILDPKSDSEREDAVFSKLSNIADAIKKAAKICASDLLELRTRYVSVPAAAPECSSRYNLTRPDGCFVLNNARSIGKKVPDWMDIALTGEFKKDENITGKIKDDIRKAMWNMHHTLREDVRRTRVWGFTIENRTLRFWFSCRADIIVSNPVDFMTTPDYIIRLFISFMYASERAMGWDSTIECLWNGSPETKPQYRIKVQSSATKASPSVVRWFQTIELISAVGAEAIRGRGTRVWRVREIVDNKGTLSSQVYVLKDAWVDSDRPFEGDVIQEIRTEANRLDNDVQKNALLSSLLTTYIHGPVLLDDGTRDTTFGDRKRKRWYAPNHPRFELTQVSSSRRTSSASSTKTTKGKSPKASRKAGSRHSRSKRSGSKRVTGDHRDTSASKDRAKGVVYGQKVHYRIVFEEDCEVLHAITSLERITYTLMKACLALKALHRLGWVHRDISTGNILLFGEDVKIADFEYAKKMDLPSKVCHEIRTGTEDFMAVEVRARNFKFREVENKLPSQAVVEDRIFNIGINQRQAPTRRKHRTFRTYTWFYNPLHDFESIYWIFKSSILNKDVICDRSHNPRNDIEEPFDFVDETERQRYRRIVHHWNVSRTLFSGRSARADFAYSTGILTRFLEEHPLHPAIQPLGEILEELRAALEARYKEVEQDPATIDHTCAGMVPDAFMDNLWDARSHLQTVPYDVQIQPLTPQYDAIPVDIRNEILAERSTFSAGSRSVDSRGSKRSRDDVDGGAVDVNTDLGRHSKSPRTSLAQQAPVGPFGVDEPEVEPTRPAVKRTTRKKRADGGKKTVPPPPSTRVLRSQTKAAALVVLSPPLLPPASSHPERRRRQADSVGRQKATKNHQAAKVGAKTAQKVKSKTRRGR